MKRIKTSGKDLLLPEDWMELPEKQRRKGFELLAAVMAGAMDPFEWQLYMLFEITGYKPSRATRRALSAPTNRFGRIQAAVYYLFLAGSSSFRTIDHPSLSALLFA